MSYNLVGSKAVFKMKLYAIRSQVVVEVFYNKSPLPNRRLCHHCGKSALVPTFALRLIHAEKPLGFLTHPFRKLQKRPLQYLRSQCSECSLVTP